MVFQVLDDLSIANSALFPCLSVGEGPEHEVEGPLHRNLQYPDFFISLSANLYKFLHFASKQLFQCVRMKLRADKISACNWYLSNINIFSGDTFLRLLDHMEFLFRLNKDVAEIN